MKKFVISLIFLVSVAVVAKGQSPSQSLKEVFTKNWEHIDQRLATLIGKNEDTIVSLLGIPSATYTVKGTKFLEFTLSKYVYVDADVMRLETYCKVLIELYEGAAIKVSTLNNHNYCANGNMLPSFF